MLITYYIIIFFFFLQQSAYVLVKIWKRCTQYYSFIFYRAQSDRQKGRQITTVLNRVSPIQTNEQNICKIFI
jgi:hypothetical protein